MGRLEPVNTNQKSPSDSGANHPTGNSCNPLLGHAISHAATLIGLFAIVLWGFMAGLVRLVSESFGATLGSALIYTVGGMLLLIVRRPKPISQAPRKYLVAGGLMFIAYEASISLSIGLATTNAQSVEVSLVNYLWPTLLVLMTAAVSHKRGSVSEALPGAIVATVGVAMAVGGENLDVQEAVANIASNPIAVRARVRRRLYLGDLRDRDAIDVRWLRWYDDFLLLRCCCAVDYPFRFGRRFASCSAWHRRLYCAARMCRVDCWRLRVLGVWHATWQYGNACDRFVCDAAVLHCFQHAPIGRDVGHAILDRCRAGGGRLADQRVVCATPLIVRFCRIGRLLVCEEATCGVVAAQRSAGMAQRYVREVTGQDNALTHPR